MFPLTDSADCHEPLAIEPALIKSFELAVDQAIEPQKPFCTGFSNFNVNDSWKAPSLFVRTAALLTLLLILTVASVPPKRGLLSTPPKVPTGFCKFAS